MNNDAIEAVGRKAVIHDLRAADAELTAFALQAPDIDRATKLLCDAERERQQAQEWREVQAKIIAGEWDAQIDGQTLHLYPHSNILDEGPNTSVLPIGKEVWIGVGWALLFETAAFLAGFGFYLLWKLL